MQRRKVFYIAGFDPLGPRRYRELYRRESGRQAEISGYEIEAGASPDKGRAHWWARCRIRGLESAAEIEFLPWDDIVKAQMGQPLINVYGLMLRTLWLYVSSGALWRLSGLRKGPIITALWPVVIMVMYLVLSALWGALAAWGFGALTGAPLWGQWILAAAVFLLGMSTARRFDRLFMSFYLIYDFGYTASARGAYPPDLSDRLDAFAQRIHDAWSADEVDEVLVVGHSSGAQIGASAVIRAVRRGAGRGAGPELSFLSLGQAIPMTSFLPEARDLRRDLHDLSKCRHATWVDVSAPGDGASFALVDPVAVSGVAPDPKDRRGPLVISAAFSHTLSAAQQKHLRWRFFLKHVQYLRAFEKPGEYDYFLITAGPVSLARRFRMRKDSPQKITDVLSPHTDML